jgi:hypothetical protein
MSPHFGQADLAAIQQRNTDQYSSDAREPDDYVALTTQRKSAAQGSLVTGVEKKRADLRPGAVQKEFHPDAR